TLLDEHRLLLALVDMEIPVCAPTPFPGGDTLATTADGIHFAIFPRTGGRSPDELTLDEFTQLGRLLARIHNVSAHLQLAHRPVLSPATYGTECLQVLQRGEFIAPSVDRDYAAAVKSVVDLVTPLWQGVETFVVHADCHRGNLLRGRDGWFFLDFD